MPWRAPLLIALVCGVSSLSFAHEGPSHRIQTITKALEHQPNNTALLLERAQLFRELGDHQKAMTDVDRAEGILGPRSKPEMAYQRGLIHRAAGHLKKADKSFSIALKKDPNHGPALAARAAIRAEQGRLRAAVMDYTQAIARRPTPERFLARGALQEHQKMWRAAARGYTEGMKALGAPVTLRLALIRVETQRKRYAKALALIDAVLAKVPVPTEWLLRRADVLMVAGRPTDAQRTYNEAMKGAEARQIKRPAALHEAHRAWALLGLGRTQEARSILTTLAQRNPGFALVQALLKRL